ncbi:ThuA domain-containing protein [Jiangella asiatica]|uniref:Carbohydrate-binding protein n=1 Tax=Jiangella asiatica TaxID=2530372 RepID=A0A4R5CP86_9ACTN|nr:ThuA domain-containing protein [Jiangella asiatica]TDE00214.1 carbohydrate-binding protein [Jiangella asiatica]
MQRRIVTLALAVLLAAISLVPQSNDSTATSRENLQPEFSALLFTKTAGFRHASIPAGVAMFEQLAADHGFELVHSEDAALFNDADLARFDVLIMLQTSGNDLWNAEQQAALQRYVRGGGGIVAIHNALDMGAPDVWFPWWDDLIGTTMTRHSAQNLQATMKVADRVHPSTAGLPERWQFREEWYNFDANPRGDVHVLATVDETTYDPGPDAMGADHPISWCRDFEGGRVWATALGHHAAAYTEPFFVEHVLGGVRTAAGVEEADCGGTVWENFQKVPLSTEVTQPMELDVADDGRVFFVERTGGVRIYQPDTGATVDAGALNTDTRGENGLQGIALDPDFATNGWVYLYYSTLPDGERRLSRFHVDGNTLDLSSEVVLLGIPTDNPERPAHVGGSVEFGPDGSLYLSTGDDTVPFESNGYSPIDERPGRIAFDAQRTSANTNDLRGKVLRIHPEEDGTYAIPDGNMFAPGTPGTRPEIFAMGFRNPFRITVHPDTGDVLVADYGPDAREPNPERGPEGYVEWQVVGEPGYYGWPYCHGDNFAYRDYDFATGASGPAFDCAAPVNDSPNNTGLAELPPTIAPAVWYTYTDSAEFPELGRGGGGPMAGPVYSYDPGLESGRKFPAYYDGKAFFYEWSRHFLREFVPDGRDTPTKINPFLPDVRFNAPMDMVFGPDGAMYVAEWGRGFGRNNPDDGIYRIDYAKPGFRSPVAVAGATPTSGWAPLEVRFDATGSTDPDEGQALTYAWDFGDGGTSTEPNPTHTYTANGTYAARLTVTDDTGRSVSTSVTISVGNTPPTVRLAIPQDGGFIDFGDDVTFRAVVTDREDGAVDCAEVTVQPALGHDAHSHPLEEVEGCRGTITTVAGGHGDDANLFYVITASYTDHGEAGVDPLTSTTEVVLQPKHRQAEHYDTQSGVAEQRQEAAEGAYRVGNLATGDWIAFDRMNLRGIDAIGYRVGSTAAGGTIQLRADSPDGPLLATTVVTGTGGQNSYASTAPVPVTALSGTHTLYFVFTANQANTFNVDAIDFIGPGVSTNRSS